MPQMPRLPTIAKFCLTVPLSALLLTACASQPPVATILPVPTELLTCRAEPAAPKIPKGATQTAGNALVAHFIGDLAFAGRDCRDKLATLGALVTSK